MADQRQRSRLGPSAQTGDAASALFARVEQPAQQQLIHASAESLLAVDPHDRHTLVVAGLPLRIGVDVDPVETQAVPSQDFGRLVAQMAAGPRIENDVSRSERLGCCREFSRKRPPSAGTRRVEFARKARELILSDGKTAEYPASYPTLTRPRRAG
jgi:hypothetical protein